MSETKFNPGPWFCSGKPRGYDWCKIMAPRAEGVTAHIATVNHWNPDVNDANAALIAAAPDLFTALEALALHIDRIPYGKPYAGRQHDLVDAARAALKKARGGA